MAPNERLRIAMASAHLTAAQLAEAVDVDPKTVERWINTGRTPHPSTARRAAIVLREDLAYLWPAVEHGRQRHRRNSEFVAAYSTRSDAPLDLWRTLFEKAERQIGVLVYAAVFLHESWPDFNELLAAKHQAGVQIRILLGDPDSPVITGRGQEEKYGHGIEARCRVAIMHYTPLIESAGVQVRLHDTTLYNSIFIGDDRMIVNAHVFGMNAYGAPVYHLKRAGDGGLFDVYAASFDEVWQLSRPVKQVTHAAH
ncbi:helix-turn-helix domain-containing protein [Nonomuraea sp. NPDC050328]|uniref:helix-turn-helix domain-containing protein n=1 Tax=Nonomuraea sp. NPDC050328 TaxID=3364361 RepID=UPI00379FD2DC